MRASLFEELEARIRSADRYVPGRVVTAGAPDEPGKLSGNEHVYGPAPGVIIALARLGARVARYPNPARGRTVVADWLGVEPDQLILTNGSDEVSTLLSRLLREDDVVVMGDPGYRMDEIVSAATGAEIRRVAMSAGRHDVEAMAESAVGARLLWLPNPHNPTGTLLDRATMARLLAAVPDDCIVVCDEAYRAYVDRELLPDTLALLSEHPNLVLQRTFSKSAGLAGLRIGYAVGDPRLINLLEAFRAPFNVNQAALAAVEASLEDTHYAEYTIEIIRRERELLQAELERLEVPFWPSQANFVTIASGDRTSRLQEALGGHAIVVRDGMDLGLPGHVRITVGAPAQMLLVRECLRSVFGGPELPAPT